MDNKETGRAMFNLQRYLILQTKMNQQTADRIPNEYAYAWYVKLYPLLNDGDWHESYDDYFDTSKEKVDIVSKWLDDEWLKQKYYSFYEIESHFKNNEYSQYDIGRNDLLCILRYLYLRGGFDKIFWDKLLEKMNHPIEATTIVSEFDSEKIYLI